jgi:haloalkane dehalogenase
VLAPDLLGFGDSEPESPGTWERHVEAVERFRSDLGLGEVVLVVHDTGGGIGLRWACDHPEAVAGMVISNTGFFPDYEWHELAVAMRTPGQGEALVDSLSKEGFDTLLEEVSSGIDEVALDEYWKVFSTPQRRRAMLELYRSFELEELRPYEGKLGQMGVPTLVLWGEGDDFLPREYAGRFAGDIPGAKLVMLEEVRHFLYEDAPDRCADEVLGFLREAGI